MKNVSVIVLIINIYILYNLGVCDAHNLTVQETEWYSLYWLISQASLFTTIKGKHTTHQVLFVLHCEHLSTYNGFEHVV